MDLSIWLSAILAVMGAFLLSVGMNRFSFATGDLFELAGSVFWAIHILLVDKVIRNKVDVILFAGLQYFIVACIQILLGVGFETINFEALQKTWLAILYSGVISVGVGYTLQAYAQRYAPPGDTAIILSMESVFAALGGFLFLGEILTPVQVLGCTLILIGVLWSQKSRIANPEPV